MINEIGCPFVSIIVPVYNTEPYISRCVDSILNQSFKKTEIILVDDGSPDKCPQICDLYAKKDSRVRVIHQQNRGVSSARNAGIEIAGGNFLMFVDSDDTLKENAVELLVSTALEYKADIVSAVKSSVDKSGTEIKKYEDGQINVYEGLQPLKLSLDYDRQTNSVCAKLFNREFVKDIRFADGKCINEDGYYIFQCYALRPKLVQQNVSVYCYHTRPESSSHRDFSEKYLEMLYFCDEKKKYISENVPQLSEAADNMEISTHLFFLEVLCRSGGNKFRNAEKNSIRLVRRKFRNYRTQNGHEKKMALIVTVGLFPLYKFLIKIKHGR